MFGAPGHYVPPTPLERAWWYVTDWWDHQVDGDWTMNLLVLVFFVTCVVVILADRRGRG